MKMFPLISSMPSFDNRTKDKPETWDTEADMEKKRLLLTVERHASFV